MDWDYVDKILNKYLLTYKKKQNILKDNIQDIFNIPIEDLNKRLNKSDLARFKRFIANNKDYIKDNMYIYYMTNKYGNKMIVSYKDMLKVMLLIEYAKFENDIKEDQIDIFVLGDFDSSKIKEIFKEYFKITTFKKENKNLLIEELPSRKRLVRYREYDKVSQAQLIVLCNLNNLTDYERRYVIKLYNELLGGSSNSILFDTVREKNSYCYYINSSVKAYDNILLINSGVEGKNIDKCIKLIKKCLKDIKDGKIKEEDIEASKNTIISGIKSSSDHPMGIINSYFSKVLVGTDDKEERIQKFSNITKEDIVKVSKKVSLHTILTLENKEEEDGEN